MGSNLPRVRIRRAQVEHLPYLIEHSEAKKWANAERTLANHIKAGFAWTGYAKMPEGWVMGAMWGILPRSLCGDEAWLWLVITDLIRVNPFLFVRHSHRAIALTFKHYPKITASVEEGNEKAERWLKWLGATVDQNVITDIVYGTRVKPVVMHRENLRIRT